MATIRLIRAVPATDRSRAGQRPVCPAKGIAALRPAVVADRWAVGPRRDPLVLVLGGPRGGRRSAPRRRPFVAGPNMLFANSRSPCRIEAERTICNAASCQLLFTESQWYRRLIQRHLGPENRAPIVLWPYPIDPRPGGPLPPQLDLLIYEKSGIDAAVVTGLQRAWPRHARVRYGRYRREQLWALARRARSCVYLSDDDRGPLALGRDSAGRLSGGRPSPRGAVHRARPYGRAVGPVYSAILLGGGGPMPAA